MRDERVPIDRVVREIWRAARRDEEANWLQMLQAPLIDTCRSIAEQSGTAIEALGAANSTIAAASDITFATEIAKRALVKSFQFEDRSQGFVEAVFAEATNYLLSRDLAGLIGSSSRCATISDAARFKSEVLSAVRSDVREVLGDTAEWSVMIDRTLQHLARRRS